MLTKTTPTNKQITMKAIVQRRSGSPDHLKLGGIDKPTFVWETSMTEMRPPFFHDPVRPIQMLSEDACKT